MASKTPTNVVGDGPNKVERGDNRKQSSPEGKADLVGKSSVLGVVLPLGALVGLILLFDRFDVSTAYEVVLLTAVALPLVVGTWNLFADSWAARTLALRTSRASPKEATRSSLGMVIVTLSVVTISALAGVIMLTDGDDHQMQVFSTLMPVLTSWVGTVLAFFFGRESFEVGNKLARQEAPEAASPPVTDVMRLAVETDLLTLDTSPADTPLTELVEAFEASSHKRMPIVDQDRRPLYLIHKSTIDAYLEGLSDKEKKGKTLVDLVNESDVLRGSRGFETVAATVTLDEVSRVMQTGTVDDIVVTERGSLQEPILGWVSDERLARHLERGRAGAVGN